MSGGCGLYHEDRQEIPQVRLSIFEQKLYPDFIDRSETTRVCPVQGV